MLPSDQELSLQLRLGQRIIVEAIVAGKKKEGAVGLGIHRKPGHRCTTSEPIRIDWEGPGTSAATHPHLYVTGCPYRRHRPWLAALIAQAIDIEDLGGLATYTGVSPAHLPGRLVTLYQSVLNARDRLLAERDHVRARLFTKG